MAQELNQKEERILSKPVKNWLASIQLTYLIIELNQRLGIPDEKQTVLPRLLWQLTTGGLPPENFANELSKQLEIAPSAGTALAKEVEEKLLRPIELPLRTEAGIDIKAIYLGKEEDSHQPIAPIAPQRPSVNIKPVHPPSTDSYKPMTPPIPTRAPQPAPTSKPEPKPFARPAAPPAPSGGEARPEGFGRRPSDIPIKPPTQQNYPPEHNKGMEITPKPTSPRPAPPPLRPQENKKLFSDDAPIEKVPFNIKKPKNPLNGNDN